MKTISLLLGVVYLVGLAGCSNSSQAVSVRGTVTLDGKPLPSGQIVFEPMEQNQQGQLRDTAIRDGVFELSAKQGLQPGIKFKVAIRAFKKTGKKYPAANPEAAYDEQIQYLPEQYNTATTLTANISADDSKNDFRYELSLSK